MGLNPHVCQNCSLKTELFNAKCGFFVFDFCLGSEWFAAPGWASSPHGGNEVCDSPWLYNGGVATVRSLSVLHQQRAAMSATDVDVSTARFDLFANTRV